MKEIDLDCELPEREVVGSETETGTATEEELEEEDFLEKNLLE